MVKSYKLGKNNQIDIKLHGFIRRKEMFLRPLRDRLLEFQKIKKIWNTHFSQALKPVEHDGKNRFSKY